MAHLPKRNSCRSLTRALRDRQREKEKEKEEREKGVPSLYDAFLTLSHSLQLLASVRKVRYVPT